MKALSLLALVALVVVSCHIDKLLTGGKTPPSDAPPARVAFSSSLGSARARAGDPITPPVQVNVQDSAGRVTLRDTLITLSLAANPGGAKLRGKTRVRSVNGVATFADLRLDKAASGYTLTAAAPNLHPDTSTAFTVMPAPATDLQFTVQPRQPSAAMQDSAIKPPVQVTAYDSLGNKVINFTGPVRVTLGNDGSVTKKATLSGGDPVPAVAGVATFPNLRIDQVGVRYTLTAAFGSAAPVAESDSFDITPGPPPPATHLRVTTSTSGDNPDTDGYTVTVDGTSSQPIGSNSSTGVTFTGLSVSSHTVELTGVATNCTVTAPNPRTVAVSDGATAVTGFVVTCTALTGSITVTTATTGSSLPSTYTVTLDGGSSRTISADGGTTTYTGLTATNHTVALPDVPGNCTVTGGASKTVPVTAGQTTTAAFTITCTALPPPTGDLTVTNSTSGQDLDPDGYTVTVDGGQSRSLGVTASTTYTLTAASHTVELSGIAANCTVSGQNPRTVTVPTGGTTTTFSITCTALPPPTGDLTVTAATSGQDLDPDGYTVTVDGGQSRSLGVAASTTYTLPAASHTVDLSGLAATCTVSGQNPRN